VATAFVAARLSAAAKSGSFRARPAMTRHNHFNLHRLRTEIKPFRLHWFSRLRSTNDHAARLRKRGELFAPSVVLTGDQIAGRGRNTNTWWSSPGSLTVTFVLPIDEKLSPHQIPLIAGLAARRAVAQISGDDGIQLKWPNDLVHRGRKLAGLLCERVHKADLIGLGLNVNSAGRIPSTLRGRIVTLEEIACRRLDKTDVLIAIAKQLYPMLTRRSQFPFPAVLREYDSHHALIGRKVSVDSLGGQCEGLDPMGRLLVRSRGHLHRIIAGQVNLH
jgi:BirA family biotin operon repressor/biotin-[acetyl-CoA-carboxylase] ligase